jgi:hypothetical protein
MQKKSMKKNTKTRRFDSTEQENAKKNPNNQELRSPVAWQENAKKKIPKTRNFGRQYHGKNRRRAFIDAKRGRKRYSKFPDGILSFPMVF